MNAYRLRPPRPEDMGSIVQLWQSAFHDPPELIEKLLEDRALLENAMAAEQDGQVCSVMFSFPGLCLGGHTATYLYALCTRPNLRGQGMASAVLRRLIDKSFSDGAELVFLSPAGEGLRHWYQRDFGMIPMLPAADIPISPVAAGTVSCTEISYKEYAALRKAPTGTTPELLRAQELLLRDNGGGFFRLDLPSGTGLACAEVSDDSLLLAELLCTLEDAATALWTLRFRFSRETVLRRVPDTAGEPLLALARPGSQFLLPEGFCFPFIMA